MPPTGLEAVFLANRDKLVRFLTARGAGDAAEDLVQDLWVKVAGRMDGPIANPLAYLYRAADMLMIDRYRSRRQAALREQDWVDGQGADPPPGTERAVEARQTAEQVAATLPFTGGDVQSLLVTALGLIGLGGIAARRRRDVRS